MNPSDERIAVTEIKGHYKDKDTYVLVITPPRGMLLIYKPEWGVLINQ